MKLNQILFAIDIMVDLASIQNVHVKDSYHIKEACDLNIPAVLISNSHTQYNHDKIQTIIDRGAHIYPSVADIKLEDILK